MLQIYFLTYFADMKEYTLIQWNIFPCHQGAHVAKPRTFNGLRHHVVQGSMFDFLWGLMGRFANRFCDY